MKECSQILFSIYFFCNPLIFDQGQVYFHDTSYSSVYKSLEFVDVIFVQCPALTPQQRSRLIGMATKTKYFERMPPSYELKNTFNSPIDLCAAAMHIYML
jgi:hypothetical protein